MSIRTIWPRRAGRRAATLVLLGLVGCLGNNDITRVPAQVTPMASSSVEVPEPLHTGRLPALAKPLRYELSLILDPQKDRFTGDVGIAVELPGPTQVIVLHGQDLTINRAEVLVDGAGIAVSTSFRPSSGSSVPDELVLTLPRPIKPGRAEIRIGYSALVSDKLSGLYRVKDGGASYAFTQLEPTDARRVMPCFDEPGFKAPFELKVTTPKDNLVFANAPEVERTPVEEGRSMTFHFAPTPPLPTYLFALAVGPFEVREGPRAPVPIRLITTRGKSGLGALSLEAASELSRLLGEYFDRPFPYAKLDLVAVPEFGFGAMENAGLISFREELILLDPKSASAESRRVLATTMAHELVHHWFGNLVTIPWWDELWLNEGFATWMEAKIADSWRPSLDARLEALKSKNAVMSTDSLASARAVRRSVSNTAEAEEVFEGLTYDKGAAVLQMLETWLGPDAFRQGVRGFIKAHENGNATARELFESLGRASGKDVAQVASSFLDQPGVPLVSTELSCEKGSEPRLKLSQSRYRIPKSQGGEEQDPVWKIPFCVAYEGSEKKGPACGLMEGPVTEITLPASKCPRYVYPNADEQGYFRFKLPAGQMRALVSASPSLGPRVRIGLLTNAWALSQSGDGDVDTLFDVLDGLKRERHRLVVEQMIATLEGMSASLVDQEARPGFRRYVSSLLLPLGKELGFKPKRGESDDQKLLRRSVISALATLAEDVWVLGEAEKVGRAYLADPRSVDPDIGALCLRVGSRRGDDKRLSELEATAQKASSPEERVAAVSAMGSFADPVLLRRALDGMLSGKLRAQDGFYVFNSAIAWHSSQAHLLSWVEERATELRGQMPDFMLSRLSVVVESICEQAARDKAGRVFGEALKGVEGADRALLQSLERADRCIELREREGAKVKKRLLKRR